MSLMAGYDFVLEITSNKILDLVKKNWSIDYASAVPPFEMQFPISKETLTGDVYLIVSDMAINLYDSNKMSLALSFERSSVFLTAPTKFSLTGLAGTILISEIILSLENQNDPLSKGLCINFTKATVDVNFSDKEKNALLSKDAKDEIQAYARKLGRQVYPPFWKMASFGDDPALNGSIIDPHTGNFDLRFVQLSLHAINSTTLAIFGTLLADKHNKGDVNLKAESAIAPGSDVAVSISPEAFHSLVFCPELAYTKTKGDISKLPPVCGGAESLSMNGIDITRIVDNFEEGNIKIYFDGVKSGPCYTASARVRTKIDLAIEDQKLIGKATLEDNQVHVDIPWYCQLSAVLVGGPLGMISLAVVDNFNYDLSATLNEVLEGIRLTVQFRGFENIRFNAIAVSPEGLTINGTVPVFLKKIQRKELLLDGVVEDVETLVLGNGSYVSKTACPRGEFRYEIKMKKQSAVYVAKPYLLARPLELKWLIGSDSQVWSGEMIELKEKEGTIVLQDIEKHFPTPGAGSSSFGEVTVHYSVSGDTIILENPNPEEGLFNVLLTVKATEQGRVFEDVATVTFEGLIVEYEKDFRAATAKCLLKHAPRKFPSHKSDLIDFIHSPISDSPVDFSDVDKLRGFITAVNNAGSIAGQQVLTSIKMAYPASFRKAVQPAKLGEVKNAF